MITASAPGKVILFGEHAVVYDKLSVAAALDKKARVTVTQGKKGVNIFSKNFNLEKNLSKEELFKFFKKISELKKRKDFDEIKEIGKKDILSPIFIVIANIMERYGFGDVNVLVDSEVPKNLGSSSAVCSATALAISKFLSKNLTKEEISNFAYEGDIIAHGGTPSGIDNSIVTYGGYIQYKRSEGIKPLEIKFELPLVIVDSGEPARTGETVPAIRKLRGKDPEFVNSILDKLGEISYFGIEALKSKDMEKIGKLMTSYYNELKKLGISTERLDKIVDLGLKNGALGAKPTGGWGGGCCIVLAKNFKKADELIKIFKKNGFNAFKTKLGVDGVRIKI